MKYIIIILIIILGSCKPKEIVITQTIRDTINIQTIEKIEVPINHTITISEPCDSLGILKDFEQTFKTNHTQVTVSNDNGAISVKINLDSIKQVWIKEYEGKTETIVKEIEVDKPIPFIPKWVWYISGILFSYITYRILRIYIPFLKILPY